MKRLSILSMLTLAVAMGPTLCQAQTFDLINARLYEPVLGSPSLHNARAIALGGAYSVLVKDASALWYNPANLGRLERTELQAELMYSRIKGESFSLTGTPLAPPPSVDPTSSSLSRTRLSSAYLAIPLHGPSTGWVLGFGMAVTHDMDRALAGNLTFAPGDFVDTLNADPNAFVAEQIEDFWFTDDQRGVVRAWQFGFGGSVSRSIMIGATGVYYDGYLELNNRTSFAGTRFEDTSSAVPGFPVRWDIGTFSTEKMYGWGAHGGVYIKPNNNFGLSAVVRSPVTFRIDLDQLITEQRDQGTTFETVPTPSTRKLKVPLAFSAGAALRLNAFRVASDLTFTDWSQSEYKDSPFISQFNDQLRKAYRESYAIAGGVEFAPRRSTFAARAGIRYARLPYNDSLTVDNHMTYSAGVGFGIDGAMWLDFAVSHDRYRGGNPIFGFDERYTQTRFVVTTAYRLP
jgi:long-subunit fatty acid transport protein